MKIFPSPRSFSRNLPGNLPGSFAQIFAGLLLVLLSGCAVLDRPPEPITHQPMSMRPEPRPAVAPENGAIYQAAFARPIFEDRRARLPGDTITIQLVERANAQKGSNASASRSASVGAEVGNMNLLPFNELFAGMGLDASSNSNFEGSGAAAANHQFNTTIAVTVIDVYPNGNLLVSGEKQVAINQGKEFIRFSGVVNPNHVSAANTVQSTQVADARIEYRGSGYLEEHQRIGWLQRFFVSLLPF